MRVLAVQLVQVDPIGTEAAQAVLHRTDDPESEAGRRRMRALAPIRRSPRRSSVRGHGSSWTVSFTAADVRLTDEVLDRIDAIVAPGTELNDDSFQATPAALTDPSLRRR